MEEGVTDLFPSHFWILVIVSKFGDHKDTFQFLDFSVFLFWFATVPKPVTKINWVQD